MKNRSFTSIALFTVALLFLIGCAGATRSGDRGTPGELPSDPESSLSASTSEGENQLSDEELLLLEDDSDWNDGPTEEFYTVPDPIEPFNRVMFTINDKLYLWIMIPVAKGYAKVVEPQIRTGVKNFFFNLGAPIRIVNNILQGKGKAAEAEVARFLYNSTVGVLGFGNPAKRHDGLNPDPEDLGQTLGVWGIGDGFFLYLPVLGPSTLRDTVGFVGDRYASPVGFVEPMELSLGLSGYNVLNTLSFRADDYKTLKDAALDPYASFRNAYIQLRQSKLRR
jgi:phospholipid-binding lipoprotein MlaA